jgi:hypothetical protein
MLREHPLLARVMPQRSFEVPSRQRGSGVGGAGGGTQQQDGAGAEPPPASNEQEGADGADDAM